MGILFGISFCIVLATLILFSIRQDYANLFSIMFAPFGMLPRYYSGKYNRNWPRFPIYTFIVNIIGSVVLEFVAAAAISYSFSPFALAIIIGVETGFCGCLTTVSGLMSELLNSNAPLKWRYLYAFLTFATAQILMICIRIGFLN